MRLVIRGHPKVRMQERAITEAEVREVLSNPVQTHPGQSGATVYTGTTSSGRTIQVVVITRSAAPGTFIVKTVFDKESQP